MIDCFKNNGRQDLQDLQDSYVAQGMKDHEAARRVIIEEYNRITSEINTFRTQQSLPEIKFDPIKEGIDVTSIEEKYNKEIEKVKNDSAKTQDFFSDVVTGKSDKYKPNKEWSPILTFSKIQESFKKIYDLFKGKFDEHIATSIPTFRETQIKVGNAIVEMLPKGGLVYDIGGSEGGFVKSITKKSDGKIETINLDPNVDMKEVHESSPVEGSRFVNEAFYESFTDDKGVTYKKHTPSKKADVVHESMVFQFITPERSNFINEIHDNYLKEDGLLLTEEKFSSDPDIYSKNESKKNLYKDQYYTKEQQSTKADDVLVGMKKNQANIDDYLKILKRKFKYVTEYWDSGNFKGFAASNSKETIDSFLKNLGGKVESEYSESSITKNPLDQKIEEKVNEFSQVNHEDTSKIREILDMDALKSQQIGVDDSIQEAQKYITKDPNSEGGWSKEMPLIQMALAGVPLDAPQQIAIGNAISKMLKERELLYLQIEKADELGGKDTPPLLHTLFRLEDTLSTFIEALDKAGSTTGRALAIRKEYLNFDKMDPAVYLASFKNAIEKMGGELTDKDRKTIDELAGKYVRDRKQATKELLELGDKTAARKRAIADIRMKDISKQSLLQKVHSRSNNLNEALLKLDKAFSGKVC